MANSVSGPQSTHLEAELAGSRLSIMKNRWHISRFLVPRVLREWTCFCAAGAGQGSVSKSPFRLQNQDIWHSASSPSAQMGNEVRKVLPLPRGHRAAEPGTEPRPASFHRWHSRSLVLPWGLEGYCS